MKKVVILQHRLLHYRISFFEALRTECALREIDLHLVHGDATRREAIKRDVGRLPWAQQVRNVYVEFGQRDILWQPFPRDLRDAALVVVMQENRLLSNYSWLFGVRGRSSRIAYWGHGRNFQSKSPGGVRERWKRYLIGRVDWWFAYTSMTRDVLIEDGYPGHRVTILNNAIDNAGFVRDLASVSEKHLGDLRQCHSIAPDAPVGLFCGSLYPDKKLDMLVAASDRVHARMPEFKLIIIGDGPSGDDIRAAAQSRPWLVWVGVKKGREKAAYFRLADVMLNPGLVGLHVLDSLCAGVPMITTSDALHSPEIAYMRHGVNGLVVDGGAEDYAEAVLGLFSNPQRLAEVRHAALQDASLYTLHNMVTRFADGIEHCLSTPRKALS